jgi:Domain of unknown function (DUF151)
MFLLLLQVTLARITALVGNTYHARMHLTKVDDTSTVSFDVDARPSDAINMAVRFAAPILVSRCDPSKSTPTCSGGAPPGPPCLSRVVTPVSVSSRRRRIRSCMT